MTSTPLSPRKASKKQAVAFVKGRIAPSQIKAIHTAVHKLGMDDDAYRDMLHSRFNAGSCKDLTWRQAEELLSSLNGTALPVRAHYKGGTLKYQDMDGRPGFASGAQLRLIDAMWNQVSRAEGEEAIEKALNNFVNRIAHVAGIRMLKSWQVEKIVRALEGMGAEKKEVTPWSDEY